MDTEFFLEDTLLYTGMPVEVQNPDGQTIFLGKIDTLIDDYIRVREVDDFDVPMVIYNTPVQLKTLSREMRIVIISGLVRGATSRFWKIDHLQVTEIDNLRENFRQPTKGTACVTSVNGRECREDIPGQVLDVSMGGLRLKCGSSFEKGDRLRLADVRIASDRAFIFVCHVQWKKASKNGFLYGCQFDPLGKQAADLLYREIMSAQLQEIRSRKARSTRV